MARRDWADRGCHGSCSGNAEGCRSGPLPSEQSGDSNAQDKQGIDRCESLSTTVICVLDPKLDRDV